MPRLQIIPALLCKTRKEYTSKLRKVEPFIKTIQVDIMDRKFVPNKTIQAKDLRGIKTKVKKEAHMMVKNPIKYVEDYAKLKFDVFIFHIEACKNKKEVLELIQKIKKKKMKPSIALNPKTKVSKIKPYLKHVNHVLVMTVHPGLMRQKFRKSTLKKVKQVRSLNKRINIEVDGGIKVGTAKKAKREGANLLVSGSGIFNYDDVKKAIENLKKD